MSETYPTLSLRERDRRWSRTRKLLRDRGQDALLVFGLKGREHFEGYLANEYIEGMAILPRDSDPALLTWHPKMAIRRHGAKTDRERFWIKDVRFGRYGPRIVEFLKERRLDRGHVGVVGLMVREAGNPEGIVPYPMWKAVLDGLPNARFTDLTWDFRDLMLEKSTEELAVLRHCAAIGERACTTMLDAVKVGASEFDIYDAIQSVIHRNGAVPHDPFLIMTWGRDDLGWFEPPWTYQGGAPRIVEPGDLIMAELFPAYGGLETQQQMSIALSPVEPAISQLGEVAHACYQAGLKALRPGNTFLKVIDAMLEPVHRHGGWTLTPMIHSVAPLGYVGGALVHTERMPAELGPYVKAEGVTEQRDLVLVENMSFAFEPNCCMGKRRVNVGGSVVVGRDAPEELNSLARRMHVVP